MDLLPLEKVFEKKAKEKSKFPKPTEDYAIRYCGLLNHLKTNIYPKIDAGLASNSDIPGFYTAHDAEHFDEVVIYAGYLLGVINGDEEINLEPYELYVLLVAIRIHDVGNIHGRENHEKRCFSFLKDCDFAGDDIFEKTEIANIAQAHGGRTTDGYKDTISTLALKKALGRTHIRQRLIASIVRFADEICESRNRASSHNLKHHSIPGHSEIFHKYASAISANVVVYEERRLLLEYRVNIEDISRTWGCAIVAGKTKRTHLIDEILGRLEKMNRERRYYNRFCREIYTIDSIRAKIEIFTVIKDGDMEYSEIIKTISVPDLCDDGYPDENNGYLKKELKEFCGFNVYRELSQARKNMGVK